MELQKSSLTGLISDFGFRISDWEKVRVLLLGFDIFVGLCGFDVVA